jgi:asparagine synthase (glutamine-hydrolysing)
MGNEDGAIQVVFNGEIYNFLEIRQILKAQGHRFTTNSDTEVIAHSYEEWGMEFINRLRGMFAFALWDSKSLTLLLARDRLGKKPLYYYLDKDRLLFASELKALLVDKSIPKHIDFDAVDAYLSFGYIPSPLTIFGAISKLLPGHFAVYSRNGFTVRPYWQLNMNSESQTRTEGEVLDELECIFDEAVRLRLISDVPLGAFLSGGVDSSAVVASMAAQRKHESVKTVSIGFSERDFDELEFGRMVARHCGSDHSEHVVAPDAIQVLEKIVWHFDEPFADASAIPTYYVSKMARERVTVALSGDGGDEAFAGYIQRYFMSRLENDIRKSVPSALIGATGLLSKVYPKAQLLPRPFRLKTFLRNVSLSVEEAYFRDMSFYFLPEMKQKLYRPELANIINGSNPLRFLDKHFINNQNPDVVTRIQYVDIMTYLPEDILVKVDRMSMANSLEVRSPILDHKLIEFVGALPSSMKLKGSESKYIFKKMNEKRLPKEILYRKKQGFCVPLAKWLRSDLKDFAAEILLAPGARHRDYFEFSYVKDLWNKHQSKRVDYSSPLWGLMMFELWHRKFM